MSASPWQHAKGQRCHPDLLYSLQPRGSPEDGVAATCSTGAQVRQEKIKPGGFWPFWAG